MTPTQSKAIRGSHTLVVRSRNASVIRIAAFPNMRATSSAPWGAVDGSPACRTSQITPSATQTAPFVPRRILEALSSRAPETIASLMDSHRTQRGRTERTFHTKRRTQRQLVVAPGGHDLKSDGHARTIETYRQRHGA